MASNSSAAAVAALFGIREGHQQDQMKPLLAQQQRQHVVAPPSALLTAGPDQAAVAAPPVKKKRTMPDPDAEVIALSPKTLMATNRFVCEVCNKGFQREQNLQLHRRGHNLPWKLKQKDPNQVQRRRVYLCPEPTCVHHEPGRALGDLTGIKKHFCRKHGEKKWKCDKCAKRYAVQSDWKAHSKICGTREYRCDCGTLFSRRDSFITHRAFCDALAQESARLPPGAGHLYGATGAANMALSLSQVGSSLHDAHGQYHQASSDLLRFGGGGGGGMAARLDHLLSSSNAPSFRHLPPPQAPPFHLGSAQEFVDGNGSPAFLQGKPFHGLMQLPDLQGNGSGGTSSSAPGLFNLGYIANSGNSSGTSSHGHASQGHMANDQISEGGGGGGAGSENSGAAFFSAGGNFSGGDHQVAPSGMYNEQSVMMPQMSATALLQKAAQMGSSTSADGGGASVFGGFMGSSVPQGRAPMLDQGQMHLQSLMNSLAGGGNGGGMFGGANGRGMIDPRLYDMDQHEVKFSQGRGGGVGGGDVTRDFLGVGGRGDMMRGMSVARGENHSGSNMSFLEAEMKSASSPFNGGRMQ
ncbi:protein indeterminate-domain 5, chloroplastic-like [Triticum urartu]|uniref:Protein EARLY HEADING DATE 2 n=1 Tax=Triticum urartu TaxID=4572 RepID=A0A8R7UXP6_TRIUA|nr:protein indeterminate-domain 5, chloroplastic-like [Triticum urartu]XP_048535279.1 protein indeterminate-domain 5, chloroplastic-like [Triticum urartu]